MRQILITQAQAGQRFDKFLNKYLPKAPGGFLYKMLRKKNITLNGKRAEGKELLQTDDRVTLFLSEETVEKFRKTKQTVRPLAAECLRAFHRIGPLQVLYEDKHILLADKPAGLLSQKAAGSELSLNEWLIGYLLERGDLTERELETFHPSVCNRLDRNTSGIVICGKSLSGSQQMSRILKDRSLHKYYLLYVEGKMEEGARIEGYLVKDGEQNKAAISKETIENGAPIVTSYRPLRYLEELDITLAEAELITGKTHQIRAHLASIGYPLVGDSKYGDPARNKRRRRQYGIRRQLLHAYKVVFPAFTGAFQEISGMEVIAPWRHGIPEDFAVRPWRI